jgi:biotin synthase-like enzyme
MNWHKAFLARIELPAYRIFLSDGTNYVTSMAKGITLADARAYFLGEWLTQPDEVTRLQVIDVKTERGAQ